MIVWKSSRVFLAKNDAAADANQAAQTQFYSTLTANYNTDFGEFEGATQNLMSVLQPIVNAGPGQYGYSAAQDAAIRGSAMTSDAAAAANSEAAVNAQITASNGGAALMPTGAQEQLTEEGDVAAAQKTATDQNAITQAGYAQGTTNYDTALSGEESVLSLENPNNFAGSATSGGNAATGAVNAATTAAADSDSWTQMVGSALGGVTGALTAKSIAPCYVAAELYGGWGDPRTQSIRRWLLLEFSKTFYGELLVGFYIQYGEKFAKYIQTHSHARSLTQKVFDRALKSAEKWER
jgi:hypothetical protein